MHEHVKNLHLTELFMGVSNWDEATRASAERSCSLSLSDQTQRARLHVFGGKRQEAEVRFGLLDSDMMLSESILL